MRHVWIFQLSTSPDAETMSRLAAEMEPLVQSWKAHGAPVPGTFELRLGRFVIVQAEPGHASGCSIDSMQRGVMGILEGLGLSTLGNERVFFRSKDGSLDSIDFREAKAAIADGRLTAGTLVYDTTLGQSNDLSRWESPLEHTWLARFLPQQV